MAWVERDDLREQRSRTYQDDTDSLRRIWSGGLAALHRSSVLDSGEHDAEIDMTLVRIDVPAFDGWRITAAGWHYALGKDLANHGDQDGWVGFGGRQGAHWFKFRLLRTGYMHWPALAWDDVGGAPDYDRANLTRSAQPYTIGPNDDEIIVSSVAQWTDLWSTPGGGTIGLEWEANGDRLKENVILNQAGREWIAANHPPTTPLSETYFGFVFRVDWSDVPRIVRQSILQDPDSDFADDGEDIILQDATERLLAFLPISEAQVIDADGETVAVLPLRKRFYKDGEDHYLLVGVRCDTLNSAPDGDVIFDPTVNYQVGASADDAMEGWAFSPDVTGIHLIHSGADDWMGARFQSVAVPNAATIDAATAEFYNLDSGDVTARLDIHCEDIDDAPQFTTDNANLDGRDKTTASSAWSATVTANDWSTTPDFAAAVKEVVDRGGWATGQDMVVLLISNDAAADLKFRTYDNLASRGAKLEIEYTAASVGILIDRLRVLRVAGHGIPVHQLQL